MRFSMKIIDRYLVTRFLTPFTYCIFSFVVLYITYDLSINLDEFIKNKVTVDKLVAFYMIRIPLILVNSTPLAILLSLLYDLGNMNRHHEIVAMRASGIHIDRIIVPFLIIGAVLAVLVFIINDQIVCKYAYEEEQLRQEIFDGYDSELAIIWKNIPFRNPSVNHDWFMESFNVKTNEMIGVVVREFADTGQIVKKIVAKNARWFNNQWLFEDGSVYLYNEDGLPQVSEDEDEQAPKPFTKMLMPYSITPEDIENTRKNISTMNFRSLLRYLMIQNKNSRLYRAILVDLHHKIAFPFVCIIAVLVAIPFAITTQRGGFIKGIGISIVIFLAYYGISLMTVGMGKNGLLPPFVSVWIPNLIFLIFGGVLIKKAAY